MNQLISLNFFLPHNKKLLSIVHRPWLDIIFVIDLTLFKIFSWFMDNFPIPSIDWDISSVHWKLVSMRNTMGIIIETRHERCYCVQNMAHHYKSVRMETSCQLNGYSNVWSNWDVKPWWIYTLVLINVQIANDRAGDADSHV